MNVRVVVDMALLKRKSRKKIQILQLFDKALEPKEVIDKRRLVRDEHLASRSAERASKNLSAIWVPKFNSTAADRKKDIREAKRGEKRLTDILSKHSHAKVGRKSDGRYDKAMYLKKIAGIFGQKVTRQNLADALLADDKSDDSCKKLRIKQGLIRRNRT